MVVPAKFLQLGSIALGSLIGLAPGSITNSDFRSMPRPMVVEINRASPAYAALEDVRYNYGFESKVAARVLPAIKVETISAGAEVEVLVAKAPADVGTHRTLRGVTVSFAENVPAPTVKEVAEVLVQQELDRRAHETPDRKIIPTQYGKPIVVSRVTESAPTLASAAVTLTPKRNLFMPTREVTLPKGWKAAPPSASRTLAANDYEPAPASAADPKKLDQNVMGFLAAKNDPLDIRGSIRFVNGMAYTPGQDTIEIYQDIDGAAVRQGEFYFHRGYFRLNAENLNGRIVAEVRSRDGEMIGRGEMLLADVAAARIEKQDIVLKVAPLFDGLIGKVVAGASSFKTLPPVDNARLHIAGLNREVVWERKSQLYVDKQIRPGSRYLLRAEAPGYWGSLFFGESGVPFEGRIFSNRIVNALLELTSNNKFTARDNENKGMIWGRIFVDGKPLKGATVELPFEKTARATYFTGFLPDTNLTTTSDNGEFVVAGVERELQVIKVTANGTTYTPVFTQTAPHHVTIVDFEVQAERPVQMVAYEAFKDETRPALMQILGEDKQYEIPVEGAEEKLRLTRGLALAEFEGGKAYRLTRVILNGYESEITAPLFSRDWAEPFGEQLVVGQIEGDDFQISVDEMLIPHVKITYLTDTGNPTDKQFGESGGGFVISGLPEGLHTLTIVPAKGQKVITQLVYVDSHAVHFFKKNIL